MVLAKPLEPHGILIYFKCSPYRGVMCVASGMAALGFFLRESIMLELGIFCGGGKNKIK